MGKEIERKFLVLDDTYRCNTKGVLFSQAYLNSSPDRVVRVRIAGEKGYITVKGKTNGCMRLEFEYEIPLPDAEAMIDNICEKPAIEKYRYKFEYDGFMWEVDEFLGVNKGLVIAEIELNDEKQGFSKPDWLGKEVTGDPRYYNSNLVNKPFTTWK